MTQETLNRIAEKLRRAGASLPAPEVTGTIEGSIVTGLCIALALVESEIEALAQPEQELAIGDVRALKHRIHALEGEVIGYKRILDAQPEHEPVLVVEKEPDYMSRGHLYTGTKPHIDPTKVWSLPIGTRLYTTPPQRTEQEPVAHCEAGLEHCPVCRAETAALAQPEQEPHCEVMKSSYGEYPKLVWKQGYVARIGDKFYLSTETPPQRKPLTDEQREEIAKGWRSRNWTLGDVIDAVEAAHNIKE